MELDGRGKRLSLACRDMDCRPNGMAEIAGLGSACPRLVSSGLETSASHMAFEPAFACRHGRAEWGGALSKEACGFVC